MTDSGSSEKAQIQEAKHKRMLMKTVLSHIIFQLQNTKKNEKTEKGQKKITYRGTIKRITVDSHKEPFKQEEISETLKVV